MQLCPKCTPCPVRIQHEHSRQIAMTVLSRLLLSLSGEEISTSQIKASIETEHTNRSG